VPALVPVVPVVVELDEPLDELLLELLLELLELLLEVGTTTPPSATVITQMPPPSGTVRHVSWLEGQVLVSLPGTHTSRQVPCWQTLWAGQVEVTQLGHCPGAPAMQVSTWPLAVHWVVPSTHGQQAPLPQPNSPQSVAFFHWVQLDPAATPQVWVRLPKHWVAPASQASVQVETQAPPEHCWGEVQTVPETQP
jgi:hypothetical protein